jgi:hypothetical protein
VSGTALGRSDVLPTGRLDELVRRHAREYRTARPFPHVVIDGLLPEDTLEEVLSQFPGPDDIPWDLYTDDGRSRKLATETDTVMGPAIRGLLRELNSSNFVAFLEQLTGITGVIPDPHLHGGGMHLIEPGGYLNVHADFNVLPRLRLDRRLNLLLYLNPGWREEWGGHLELWNSRMTKCIRRISPLLNRCVIFSTSDQSFHGHPVPLACPPGVFRRSLALYYYSNGRPEEEASPAHSTLYQTPVTPTPSTRLRAAAREVLPPIVVRALRRARHRRRTG